MTLLLSGGIEVRQSGAHELLQSLDADSVPLIVADPPYGIGYHSNYYKDRNPHAPIASDWNFQVGPFLADCARVLTDGGALYLFCRWDVMPLWLPAIIRPLKVKTVIAWVKDNWSAGDLTGSFGNQYEQVLFITKGRHRLRGRRWSNVWEFSRVPHGRLLHPAQKPTALIERMVLSSTDEGDRIVDPFCGSGTTGEAASLHGRDALLGDLDADMVRASRERLGLPVEEPGPPVLLPSAEWEPPSPEAWGVHPEVLQEVWEMIEGNRAGKRGSTHG